MPEATTRKVYMTGLRPEHRQAYIDAHSILNHDLNARCRAAGMRHCSVHLLGNAIVLVIDALDHALLAATLAKDPVDIAWQNEVRPMKDEGDWQGMKPIFYVDL